jgi:hypothetical protein
MVCIGNQCFGSGSGWIRIQFWHGSGIRIRNPDPDSGSRCLKIGFKKLKFTMTDFKDENKNFYYSGQFSLILHC